MCINWCLHIDVECPLGGASRSRARLTNIHRIGKPIEFEVDPQNLQNLTRCVHMVEYSTMVEISTWKLFFHKLQVMLDIFNIWS